MNVSSTVKLSGYFSTMYGDPPAGSDGSAVIEYWLEEEGGGLWQLIFDDDVYRPPGGFRTLEREEVVVEGTLAGQDETIVVTSIELAGTAEPRLATPAPTGAPGGATPTRTASNVQREATTEVLSADVAPVASAAEGSVVTLVGFFSTDYGDPPAGSGLPSVIEYWLEDGEGDLWSLVFDQDVYRPELGIRQFHRERVVVAGVPNGNDSILVTAIALSD